MLRYKNLSDQRLVIPGVGEVEPGAFIESENQLHNVNLQLVKAEPQNSQQSVPPQHPTAPAAVSAPVYGNKETL